MIGLFVNGVCACQCERSAKVRRRAHSGEKEFWTTHVFLYYLCMYINIYTYIYTSIPIYTCLHIYMRG